MGTEIKVLRFQEQWNLAMWSDNTTAPLLKRLWAATMTTFLYLEEIHEAFDVWISQQNEALTLASLAVCVQFRRLARMEWLLSGADTTIATSKSISMFFRREAGLMHELLAPIPRSVSYSPKVFAHLFSGARRKGDFQQHVEALQAMATSVNIIFDLTWGNLLQPSTFELFAKAMHERVLSGFLSGPPCETWSRARTANDKGPRVLRSRDRLQGCPYLTRRETEQVCIGNQLLGVTLRLFLVGLLIGALAILEHPACPNDDLSLPAIWHLNVIRCLMRFPGCVKLRIFQGLYGGLSPKATDLLFANCGTHEEIKSHFCSARTTPMPVGGRIGRGADRKWRTAVLKKYPNGLCRAFATLFMSRCAHLGPVQELPL